MERLARLCLRSARPDARPPFVVPRCVPALRIRTPRRVDHSRPPRYLPLHSDPATNNIQTQKNGFGTFVQKFQLSKGKSKYGVPIFLPNGNVNPAYLAAERADSRAASKRNTKAAEAKRKNLISKKSFELADYVRKKVGEVGSGKDYYQSGR